MSEKRCNFAPTNPTTPLYNAYRGGTIHHYMQITCPTCSAVISDRCTECPYCGTKLAAPNPIVKDHVATTKMSTRNLDSAKAADHMNNTDTAEWLRANTKISGWLKFFLIVLPIGVVLSIPVSIFTSLAISGEADIETNDIIDLTTSLALRSLVDMAMVIYIIYAFVKRKPNAVLYAASYLAVAALTVLVVAIGYQTADTLDHTNNIVNNYGLKLFRSVLYHVGWIVYLFMSKQVKTILPESYRKITIIDGCIVFVYAFVSILLALY